MSKFIRAAVCAVALAGVVAIPAAGAEAKSLRSTYTDVRFALVKKEGVRAAGRNIRRFGVRTGHGSRTATRADYRQSIAIMRRTLHPGAYLRVKSLGPPAQPPTGAATARYAPAGVAACIVSRESGGDPQARNGQYTGIAQWSQDTWRKDGGTAYAATPTGASYQQQLQVLNQGISRYGTGDWSPYDGC